MKKRHQAVFIILIATITLPVVGQETIQFPALKKQIDSLMIVDQRVQQDFINGDQAQRLDLERIEKETFIRHTVLLKIILEKYGFPNFDKVGKEASNNYWLCVQHSDHDLKFQEEVLRLMRIEVKNKKADPTNFAFLTDRVNLNSGKSQIYGTQVTYKDRTAIPKDLKDPKTVNKRRTAVGLGPIEEYLNMMTELHRQMNPQN